VAVVATLSKGYDLDYIWKQVDRGPAKDAATYYIQASESGEPPGRWWGPGAKALGFEHGQRVERQPYNLLFGERKAPEDTQLGRPPGNSRKAADLYAVLLAAEPHATAERRRELRTEATKKARQSPQGPGKVAFMQLEAALACAAGRGRGGGWRRRCSCGRPGAGC
jgi:hypothetical protein